MRHLASPVLVIALISLLCRPSLAALPPGYEDEMWCPPGYCDRSIQYNNGFVGPNSAFHECYNPADDSVVDETWTGSLTNVTVPEGWLASPEACDEARLDDAGTMGPSGSTMAPSDELPDETMDTVDPGTMAPSEELLDDLPDESMATNVTTTTTEGEDDFNTTSRCNPALEGGRRNLQDGCEEETSETDPSKGSSAEATSEEATSEESREISSARRSTLISMATLIGMIFAAMLLA